MRLTTRGRYGVRAMLALALLPEGETASVTRLATQEAIPVHYLEQLLLALRRAGLLLARRGMKGGYALARPAREITLAAILAAVGETLALGPVGEDGTADPVTDYLWQRLQRRLEQELAAISLEDLYFDARSWDAARCDDARFIV